MTAEIAGALGLDQAHGALVVEAQADSPAAKAGITAGDVVDAVNGAPIKEARELPKAIASTAPGTAIKLGVRRQGKEMSVTVTLEQLPNKRPAPGNEPELTGRGNTSDPYADLGLRLAPASGVPGAGKQGVVVTGVDPTGLGADQGFGLGDVILEVSGKSVATPAEIQSVLSDAHSAGKQSVLMRTQVGRCAAVHRRPDRMKSSANQRRPLSMTSLTREDVIAMLGQIDDGVVASIIASGATAEELAEARAWLANDEPSMNAGRPLATGRVAHLVDLISALEEEEEELARQG